MHTAITIPCLVERLVIVAPYRHGSRRLEKRKEKKKCSSFAVRAGLGADPVTRSVEADCRGVAQYSKINRRRRETSKGRTRKTRGGSRWFPKREWGTENMYIGQMLRPEGV